MDKHTETCIELYYTFKKCYEEHRRIEKMSFDKLISS